jgi:hypothetical protein
LADAPTDRTAATRATSADRVFTTHGKAARIIGVQDHPTDLRPYGRVGHVVLNQGPATSARHSN